MPQRYFLELMYKGTNYSGFQVQENAPNTIQQETEKALAILAKQPITMTGSSRTDTGVHALQNFFHFDFDGTFDEHLLYKINSIIPRDIVIKNIYLVPTDAHCRFDAISRSYSYHIYQEKNPFLADKAYYFPYSLSLEKLQEAAAAIKTYTDFTSFSKRNTQVKTFVCSIIESEWKQEGDEIIYKVKANRFLRGMVRGLTATMLLAGRNKINIDQFKAIIEAKDCKLADFSVPGHGLFLINVEYPAGFLPAPLAMRQAQKNSH
ncbi:MAG TPA: tRNA pseudouridine(38-40) synthase TruA [Chitinophagaceae bacterium]|nr:tRNA pseudouridine(38-40) synthase TruA [Chitinophagaceae bacterium]